MNGNVPHVKIVVLFCVAAVVAYFGFSVYVVAFLKDPALTGDVIGTWKSFAVGVFAFWVGSSSGSKAKDGTTPAGTEANPIHTQINQPASDPVPTVNRKPGDPLPAPNFGGDP